VERTLEKDEEQMSVGKIEQLTVNREYIQHAPDVPELIVPCKGIVKIRDPIMKFENLVEDVNQWAKERGIFEKGTKISQHVKTQEEVDELKVALEENNKEEIVDALGDILITLIIQAEMQNLKLLDCLESTYNVIKHRTGKMENGLFVKDQ